MENRNTRNERNAWWWAKSSAECSILGVRKSRNPDFCREFWKKKTILLNNLNNHVVKMTGDYQAAFSPTPQCMFDGPGTKWIGQRMESYPEFNNLGFSLKKDNPATAYCWMPSLPKTESNFESGVNMVLIFEGTTQWHWADWLHWIISITMRQSHCHWKRHVFLGASLVAQLLRILLTKCRGHKFNPWLGS